MRDHRDRTPRHKGRDDQSPAILTDQGAERVDPLAALQEASGNAAVGGLLEQEAKGAEGAAGSPPAHTPAQERPDGAPLPSATQAHFEALLNYPLDDVRLHTGPEAAQATEVQAARAFTQGQDIYFGPGQYAPERPAGHQLLAHELAHVVQQGEGVASGVQTKPKEKLDDLSTKEKGRIRVITDPVLSSYDPFFSSQTAKTSVNLPTGVTAVFGPTVDKKLQAGLQSVAGDVSTGQGAKLVADSSVTLALDLTKHGSDHAAYRFTWITGNQGKGGEILIERLGPVGNEKLSKPQKKAAEGIIKARNIKLSGFGSDEADKVRMALAALPQTGQDNLKDLQFVRVNGLDASDPQAGGHYDPDTHTITLFNPAFQGSLTRVGDAATGFQAMDVRAIVHEIGHVMDLYKFNQAYNEAQKIAGAKGVKAAEKHLKAARSPSGHRWSQEKVPGEEEKKWMHVQISKKEAKTHDYRQAVKKDGGKEITQYATTDWLESYAESYSLFVTDPERLKALRPEVYAYFKKKFPK